MVHIWDFEILRQIWDFEIFLESNIHIIWIFESKKIKKNLK